MDVADDLSYVVVGDLAGPSCADTFSPVHQHSGDDGHVPLRLYALVVVIVVLEQVVIHRWENKAGQRAGRSECWEKVLIMKSIPLQSCQMCAAGLKLQII